MQLDGIELETSVEDVALGVIIARGCEAAATSDEQAVRIREVCEAVQPNDDRKQAVRQMLRFGNYKPTGRGKPACEYLLKCAQEERFPKVNNLVDVLNTVSLEMALPISMLDLERAAATAFRLRRGVQNESFVFNAAGQSIELEDLLLLAALPEDTALANPVKDSMRSKLVEDSSDVMAVVYGPTDEAPALRSACEKLAEGVLSWAGADSVAIGVLVS